MSRTSRSVDERPADPGPPESSTVLSWLRARPLLAIALLATLGLLIAHALSYRFLTDDAFIAFRYARNLAHGDGLVFNPGMERVEGFTSLLWVLLLSAFARLGVPPESSALLCTAVLTVLLWAIVVRETLRRAPVSGAAWLVLVPPLVLAASRTVAVWSSGGLETRLFEVLILWGGFRLVREVERLARGESPRPLAAVAFGLAEWARPEGAFLGAAALAVAALLQARRARAAGLAIVRRAWPFVALVAVHLAIRLAYFGEWVPNTYYVKIDGRTWWTMGLQYLGAFVLEYGMWLWIPLLALGVVRLRREGRGLDAAIAAALLVPLMVYLAAIGGDHFEYRPLGLVFPLAGLLLFDGLRELAGSRSARAAVPLAAALVFVMLWQLPSQSRRQSPTYYAAGFPGGALDTVEGRSFLEPERDPLYRLPGLRAIALLHQRLVRECTAHFVGVRREEHVSFLQSLRPAADTLRALVDRGDLPRDFHVALPCVGLIPYVSDLPTLDRIGLTDKTVARQPFFQKRMLVHDKSATLDYARRRGVDLWCDVRPVCDVTSADFLKPLEQALATETPLLAARLGPALYLVGESPLGARRLAARAPRLAFEPMADPRFLERFNTEAVAAYRGRLARSDGDDDARLQLAVLLAMRGDFGAALDQYRIVSARRPEDWEIWFRIGWCHAHLGAKPEAVQALEHGLSVSRRLGDPRSSRTLEAMLGRLRAAPAERRALAAAVTHTD